ncbi:MAG TPA: hypothetical protein VI452_09870 [Marmoricola sp.]
MSARCRLIPRRSYLAGSLGIVLALTAGGFAGWDVVATRTADRVHVTWQPDASSCTGHALQGGPKRLGLAGVPVLSVHPGTSCTVQVRVVNASPRPVRLDSIIGGLLGPQSSHILTAVHATDGGRPRGDRLDAYWPVHRTIAPHHTARYRIGVRYRPSGCDGNASAMGIGGFPDAHITVLGRGYIRLGTRPLHWVQRGRSPGCGQPR